MVAVLHQFVQVLVLILSVMFENEIIYINLTIFLVYFIYVNHQLYQIFVSTFDNDDDASESSSACIPLGTGATLT